MTVVRFYTTVGTTLILEMLTVQANLPKSFLGIKPRKGGSTRLLDP